MSKMSLAPVFYTLTHIQFNPIAQMSEYVGKLQERLRRNGFPDFSTDQQIELTIRQLDKSQPEVQHQPHTRWSFSNANRTEGYLLLPNALVFHTTEYNDFDSFLKKAIFGLELVDEIVDLNYVDRIGLRYLDAIIPMGDDILQQYLNPSLLGLSTTLEGRLNHSFTETVTVVDNGTLVARSMITDGGLALTPDLFSLQLELNPRFTAINGRHTVIDTDYFIAERSNFNLVEIEDRLRVAHNIITTAFKASVTEYAMEKWG
jgi:uncharacterized protein (TIGR04255 family)